MVFEINFFLKRIMEFVVKKTYKFLDCTKFPFFWIHTDKTHIWNASKHNKPPKDWQIYLQNYLANKEQKIHGGLSEKFNPLWHCLNISSEVALIMLKRAEWIFFGLIKEIRRLERLEILCFWRDNVIWILNNLFRHDRRSPSPLGRTQENNTT